MKQQHVIALTFLFSFFSLLSIQNAYAFSNCQVKYDSDKRALSSLKGMCNVCHLSPSGSGPQNEFGRAFANAGFMITDDLVKKFPNFFQKSEPKEEQPAPLPSPQAPSTGSSSEPSTQAVVPSIKRMKPLVFKINTKAMASIFGDNFIQGTKVFVDNNEVLTSVKSNMLLLINFMLGSTGEHNVQVKNLNGQESNTVKVKGK